MNNFGPGNRQRGALHATSAAMITVIAIVMGVSSAQLALTSNAKTTLDYAALMAARAGAVANGDEDAIIDGLIRGLAPLYGSSSAPTGASTSATEGVDWIAPDPSTVDRFGQTLLGGDNTFSAEYQADVARTVRGDASVSAAIAAAEADLLGGGGQLAGVAITNPVSEVFNDFGQEVDGVMELPNKGVWRRTGNRDNATSSNIQVCSDVAEPFYEDPTVPPSFNEPSSKMVRDIVGGFTWNTESLKQEKEGCELNALGNCGIGANHSALEAYVEQVSGPKGEELQRDIDSIIDDYENARIDSATMYRRIRERAERMKAEFEAADVQSVTYCEKKRLGGKCRRGGERTYTPESTDWGPMSRIDELIQTAGMLESGTGQTPAGGSMSLDDFEAAIGNWRERNQNKGEASSEWDNFVGSELEPLWVKWIEEPPVPLYKNFMDAAAQAAKGFDGTAGLTKSQEAYLDYLQAVNDGVYEPNISYVKSQNCESKQVEGYVAPTVGTASDLNIQDANILRIFVLYGHEPFFDLPESFYNIMGWTQRLTPTGRTAVPASLRDEYDAIVAAGRIPLMGTALVRMQSELRENSLMVSRGDSFFNWEDLGVQ